MAVDLKALAFDVYQYAYPLVIMDLTMRQATNVPDADTAMLRAPVNQFAHARAYPPAESKEVVRFNFDTLYSFAWLDLRDQPQVLTVPDGGGRYYLVPMLDMWTDVFAVPGTRTTGGRAGSFLITAPGWTGTVPDNLDVIGAPTPIVWIMGRTQTNGPADYDAVHAFQNRFTLTPLSAWGTDYTPPRGLPIDPAVDDITPPQTQVNALTGVELLTRFAELLAVHPPHANDYPILFRMRALGLEPGKPFTPDTATAAIIDEAARDAFADMRRVVGEGRLGTFANGWNWATSLGTYATDYRLRALVAWAGLGANLPADALYPNAIVDADGEPTIGAHDYVLRFEKGQTPAADAFWSLTMYDGDGFQVSNPVDRFVIRDRDPLTYGPDGSLEIYIQHASPGPDRESNWLPAPAGPFQVMLRVYSPRGELLRGEFEIPPIRKSTGG
ncbi:DUF1254 domain-containing protein [Nocardia aurantiaca]|nr:DUF1254 domain-containing protein [Nocardia aurantiaca]